MGLPQSLLELSIAGNLADPCLEVFAGSTVHRLQSLQRLDLDASQCRMVTQRGVGVLAVALALPTTLTRLSELRLSLVGSEAATFAQQFMERVRAGRVSRPLAIFEVRGPSVL